ncbi:MAG: hypothetical protein H0X33_05685 [Taibaiella sp.]|nr:hypothetical protein [Taibaiella sp.]
MKHLILVVAISCLAIHANAQIDATTRIQLQARSDSMWQTGNMFYLLVDAYLDGLVPENISFDISWEKNNIIINGKPVPEKLRAAYLKKADFFALYSLYEAERKAYEKIGLHILCNPEDMKSTAMSMRGEGFTSAELFTNKTFAQDNPGFIDTMFMKKMFKSLPLPARRQ